MSKVNNERKGCRDVFNAFLVENAEYESELEFPIIKGTQIIPQDIIVFSKCISNYNYKKWVHFYEDDFLFERIWRNPAKYLSVLSKYEGIILPDFSLYRDMPLVMQLWNIYRSRAIGCWLQSKGLKVIPNIRFADERTYQAACIGIEPGCTIAIGSHGTLKNQDDKLYFKEGLEYIVSELKPKSIVVYGKAPADIFDDYKNHGINIISFDSDYSTSRKGVE